jgi:hypothetical protein
MSTGALFYDEMSKTTGVGVSDWVILERMLAQWWHLVAFMKAMNLLHQVMHAVYYHRIAMAIKLPRKVGTFCIIVVLIVALAAAGTIRSE